MDIRGEARKLIKEVMKDANLDEAGLRSLNSKDDPGKFKKYTDTSHESMWKNWSPPNNGQLTACNGWAGWYARALRARLTGTKAPTTYLGTFVPPLDKLIQKIHMGHAWVNSSLWSKPKYGDICQHKGTHLGLSIGFTPDNRWIRLDAGQGGPVRVKGVLQDSSTDRLKVVVEKKPFDYRDLTGWVDIEAYYGTMPQPGPVPDWLVGWWQVNFRGEEEYYYFAPNRSVEWSDVRPGDAFLNGVCPVSPIPGSKDVGHYALKGNELMVRWTTGTVEEFGINPEGGGDQMAGTWNRTEAMTARKM